MCTCSCVHAHAQATARRRSRDHCSGIHFHGYEWRNFCSRELVQTLTRLPYIQGSTKKRDSVYIHCIYVRALLRPSLFDVYEGRSSGSWMRTVQPARSSSIDVHTTWLLHTNSPPILQPLIQRAHKYPVDSARATKNASSVSWLSSLSRIPVYTRVSICGKRRRRTWMFRRKYTLLTAMRSCGSRSGFLYTCMHMYICVCTPQTAGKREKWNGREMRNVHVYR